MKLLITSEILSSLYIYWYPVVGLPNLSGPFMVFFYNIPMSTIHRYDPLTINPSKSLCDDLVYTEVCVLLHPLDVIGGDVQFLQLFHHLTPTACCKRQRLQQIADWLIDWIDNHVIDCLCCFTSLRWYMYIALDHKHKLY